MKDPGPYPVELLKAILDATGPPAPASPGLYSLSPIIYPAIFYDDGRQKMPYLLSGNPAGWAVVYGTDGSFVGVDGLIMATNPTVPAGGDTVEAIIHLPLNELPIIRLQALFARPLTTSTHYYTEFRLRADDETSYFNSQVRIGWQAPSVEYWKKTNAAWSYTIIPDWLVQPAYKAWNHLQLAINVATGCYHEIKLNGKTLSIPTQPLDPGVTQNRGRLLDLRLKTTAQAAACAATVLNQILVTAEAAPQ